ncbi:hypothetical protein [Sinorhizobium sp. RAC02]|uniref:hypothetical protein n=1 Tax=Sinorhizobium sp. RAC02 TaxID=1842534 RepID=UPI00083D299E|nr:hypothetical protein [Sinorhizobium sp. RAC02]AOF91635.1 putative membrane protein [Sinorhizobium sp. RAC02]
MSETASSQRQVRPGLLGLALALRAAWLGMDKAPAAIAFATSMKGIVLLHVAVFLVFCTTRPGPGSMLIVALGLAGCAAFPARRTLVIGLTTLFFIMLRPTRSEELSDFLRREMDLVGTIDQRILIAGAGIAFLAFGIAALRLQSTFRTTAPGRHPVLTMMLIFFAVLAVPLSGLLPVKFAAEVWLFLAALASGFWCIAYALADQKVKQTTNPLPRVAFFRPFWEGPTLPIGKGAGFLAKFEAKDETALAVTRLKGLKLIVWGALLAGADVTARNVLNTEAGVPVLADAMAAAAKGAPLPAALSWASLVVHYLLDILHLAAWGHIVVALIRVAGYGIPRNTVRPLAARSLAEFWNRYYFYFKELLVDFFFYPAFLRWFKKHPRLRVAFATFCAACVGNWLFHFMGRIDILAVNGVLPGLRAFESYLLYCVVLAGGLIVSQLRNRRPKPEDGFLRYDVLPRLQVGLFFCLLTIFNEPIDAFTIGERFAFLFSLFGA